MVNQATLQVTLTNTSAVGAASAADVLTGVYFTAQNTTMSAASAIAAGILGCSYCGSNINVGGEWAFAANVGGLVSGSPTMVLGAADLGIFTTANNIRSTNLYGTANVGNADFGIVSSNTNPANLLNTPVVRNTVIFTLGTSSGFNTSSIGTIGFLFGNGNYSYNWNQVGGGDYDVPELGTNLLTGIGLIGLGLVSRRRARQAKLK